MKKVYQREACNPPAQILLKLNTIKTDNLSLDLTMRKLLQTSTRKVLVEEYRYTHTIFHTKGRINLVSNQAACFHNVRTKRSVYVDSRADMEGGVLKVFFQLLQCFH